jgi:CARDB
MRLAARAAVGGCAVLALAAGLAVALDSSSSARPDLVARGVKADAGSVAAGGSVRAATTIRNRGRAGAGRSIVAFYLSADRRRDGSDARLGRRRAPALAPGRTSRTRRRVRVPSRTAPGRYRLLACADAKRAVGEHRERNNCRSAPLRVTAAAGGDTSRPEFGGLEQATTCLPGPVGPGRASAYTLGWSPASDDRTPRAEIVYDVYRATGAGGQDFSRPTYTSAPGATSFTTPELSSESAWYFVVRARDGAGNRDGNRVERQGQNMCR